MAAWYVRSNPVRVSGLVVRNLFRDGEFVLSGRIDDIDDYLVKFGRGDADTYQDEGYPVIELRKYFEIGRETRR